MLPPGLDPVEEEPLLLSRNDGRCAGHPNANMQC